MGCRKEIDITMLDSSGQPVPHLFDKRWLNNKCLQTQYVFNIMVIGKLSPQDRSQG